MTQDLTNIGGSPPISLFNQTRRETALSRLHIGHSHITNLFLLKGEEPPSCVSCDEPLSLQHILISCSDLIDIRQEYFNVNSLKVLFKEVCFGYHLQPFERD